MTTCKHCSKKKSMHFIFMIWYIWYHGYQKCGRQMWHVGGWWLGAHGDTTSEPLWQEPRVWSTCINQTGEKKENLSDHDHLFYGPRGRFNPAMKYYEQLLFMALGFNEEQIIKKKKKKRDWQFMSKRVIVNTLSLLIPYMSRLAYGATLRQKGRNTACNTAWNLSFLHRIFLNGVSAIKSKWLNIFLEYVLLETHGILRKKMGTLKPQQHRV